MLIPLFVHVVSPPSAARAQIGELARELSGPGNLPATRDFEDPGSSPAFGKQRSRNHPLDSTML